MHNFHQNTDGLLKHLSFQKRSSPNQTKKNKTKNTEYTSSLQFIFHLFSTNSGSSSQSSCLECPAGCFWLMKQGLRAPPQKHHSCPTALPGRSQGTGRVRTHARGQNQRGEPWRQKITSRIFTDEKMKILLHRFFMEESPLRPVKSAPRRKGKGREKKRRDINQKRCLWNHRHSDYSV